MVPTASSQARTPDPLKTLEGSTFGVQRAMASTTTRETGGLDFPQNGGKTKETARLRKFRLESPLVPQ